MALIKWLAELGEEDLHLAGGKAANLGVLFNNDFPVPNGFVVSAEVFNHFLTKTGIKKKINNYLEKLDVEDHKRLKQVSESIKELFLGGDIPPGDSEKIERAYSDLNAEAVVCRSSSTFEDSERASFAGQHETFVNVTTFMEVVNSVKKCWSSLYTPRALSYARLKGCQIKNAEMAALIQVMVHPEKAGVMFTSHSGKSDQEILIEANWGLGDSVVSGEVTPDQYAVNKQNFHITKSKVSKKDEFSEVQGEKVRHKQCSKHKRNKPCLNKEEVVNLAKKGSEIERIFGSPQDIEWSIENSQVYILQSRPIAI